MANRVGVFAGFCLLLASCSQKKLSERELINYIGNEENGLHKIETNDHLRIGVKYVSNDLLVMDQTKNQSDINIDSVRQIYAPFMYFKLSVSVDSSVSNRGYAGPANNFNSIALHLSDYINITTSKNDTVSLTNYSYVPTYGLGSELQILLVFEKEIKGEWLVLNCKDLGMGMKKLHFKFSMNDIANVPKLNYTHI